MGALRIVRKSIDLCFGEYPAPYLLAALSTLVLSPVLLVPTFAGIFVFYYAFAYMVQSDPMFTASLVLSGVLFLHRDGHGRDIQGSFRSDLL
jgi:hypothetical protein